MDRSYHDVTVVDMEDEREPMVVLADMTQLRELWPPEVFNHMKWFQQDLELMRKSAKKQNSQTRPMPCKFCGKVIRVDMYRHVARLHLDLVQLWRCPIAWCTTWKGLPQDCLEHLRNGHDNNNNNNNIYSYSKYRKQVHYRTEVRTCALNRT